MHASGSMVDVYPEARYLITATTGVIQTGQCKFVLSGSLYLQAFQRSRTECKQLPPVENHVDRRVAKWVARHAQI
jgi:hypothetical protein